MKIAYFDCFSGISGDMILGALVDLGIDLEMLRAQLARLSLSGYEIESKAVFKNGVRGTQVRLKTGGEHKDRRWVEIKALIDDSSLPQTIKDKSKEIFHILAQAESRIHAKPLREVVFHEIGAVDSIIDIVGAVIGLELLGVQDVFASRLPLGSGNVNSRHGVLPVPAPATMEILKGVPITIGSENAELVTPTGAAIIKQYASSFGFLPPITTESIGYGAGQADLLAPNLLRVIVGTVIKHDQTDEVIIIQSNIDDTSPEIIGHTIKTLFEAGALDVWWSAIGMKKERPGIELNIMAPPGMAEDFVAILIKETGTLGCRLSKQSRVKTERTSVVVSTRFGSVRVKIGRYRGETISVAPEYEDCVKLAKELKVQLKDVYAGAIEAVRQ